MTASCIDCDAPLRPLPPEFQEPPQQPDPPEVTRLESWTGNVLYCLRCFDAMEEQGESA